MAVARWLPCDGVFRFLSGTEIDHDYERASSNNNKVNPVPYERPTRNCDAEDSDGNGVTDTVKSYPQSQAETFKLALCASWSSGPKVGE
jgi:hypothetical protein